jgi:hypothetical protein
LGPPHSRRGAPADQLCQPVAAGQEHPGGSIGDPQGRLRRRGTPARLHRWIRAVGDHDVAASTPAAGSRPSRTGRAGATRRRIRSHIESLGIRTPSRADASTPPLPPDSTTAGVLGRVGRASSTSSSARVRARCIADHPAVLVGKGHVSTPVEFLLQASAALPDVGPGELAAGLATARAEMEERPWTLPSGRLRAGQRGLAVSALLIAVAVDHVVLGPLKRLDRPAGAAEEAGSVMPRASVAAAQVVSSRVVVVVTQAVHRSRPVRRTSARDSYGASEGER